MVFFSLLRSTYTIVGKLKRPLPWDDRTLGALVWNGQFHRKIESS